MEIYHWCLNFEAEAFIVNFRGILTVQMVDLLLVTLLVAVGISSWLTEQSAVEVLTDSLLT